MDELDNIVTLAEAADELGIAAVTLRHQAGVGRLRARLVGKTWITTRQEVERYRHESLGQPGRLTATSPRGHRNRSEIKHPPKDDDTKTDMDAQGEDGQVYGG